MVGKNGIALALGLMAAIGCGYSAQAKVNEAGASATASSAETAAEIAEGNKIKAILASLHPVTGTVNLPEAEAQLRLGTQYYFLNAADAKKVVTDVWGNPPSQAENVLGMIVPKDGNPVTSWGAVITYEKTGYVADSDASSTDYGQYIKQIQDGEADDNARRKKDGYATTHLVGWAQPPSYDKASHSMIWARDLQFSGAKDDTLNYDVRLLGRHGVLSLNMVDVMPDLASVREQAKQLAAAGSFVPGSRYEDYQAGTDHKAAFGLAGLVAAGVGVVVAKKLGLIGLILLFGKKAIVLVLAAGAAIARWFGSIFGRKKKAAAKVSAAQVNAAEDLPPASPIADDAATSPSSES